MKNIPIHSRASSDSPVIELPNLFHLWLQWLKDLGGEFIPVRDLSEPKPRTGRRDPDKRARDYPDRKSTRLNSSHIQRSRMPSSA